ncbi:MAG: hypothetical protein V2I65_02790 [Paracoccaceae bacterium]|jgi:hypothetical protein|nr:hypothetical protein [Paracoccaceae bacterium]
MSTDIARRMRNNRRLGGFLAGLLGTLFLGIMAGVLFQGGGFGDPDTPPPQVYTGF